MQDGHLPELTGLGLMEQWEEGNFAKRMPLEVQCTLTLYQLEKFLFAHVVHSIWLSYSYFTKKKKQNYS